jgi:hypothetical protein
MRLARVTILVGLLVSVVLILSHLLGLPGYPTRGWFFAPRVQKTEAFSIEGDPFDHESWTSRGMLPKNWSISYESPGA